MSSLLKVSILLSFATAILGGTLVQEDPLQETKPFAVEKADAPDAPDNIEVRLPMRYRRVKRPPPLMETTETSGNVENTSPLPRRRRLYSVQKQDAVSPIERNMVGTSPPTPVPFKHMIDLDRLFFFDDTSASKVHKPNTEPQLNDPCYLQDNDHLKGYANKKCPPKMQCVDKHSFKPVSCKKGEYCDCPVPPGACVVCEKDCAPEGDCTGACKPCKEGCLPPATDKCKCQPCQKYPCEEDCPNPAPPNVQCDKCDPPKCLPQAECEEEKKKCCEPDCKPVCAPDCKPVCDSPTCAECTAPAGCKKKSDCSSCSACAATCKPDSDSACSGNTIDASCCSKCICSEPQGCKEECPVNPVNPDPDPNCANKCTPDGCCRPASDPNCQAPKICTPDGCKTDAECTAPNCKFCARNLYDFEGYPYRLIRKKRQEGDEPCPRGCKYKSNCPPASGPTDGICGAPEFPEDDYSYGTTPIPDPPRTPGVYYVGARIYGEDCDVYGDLVDETMKSSMKHSAKIKRLKAKSTDSTNLGRYMCRWTPDNLECIPKKPRKPSTTVKAQVITDKEKEQYKRPQGNCTCRIALGGGAVTIDYRDDKISNKTLSYCYIPANRGPYSNCDHEIFPPYGAIRAVRKDGTPIERLSDPASKFCVPDAECRPGFKYTGLRCMCPKNKPWNFKKFTCTHPNGSSSIRALALLIILGMILTILGLDYFFW